MPKAILELEMPESCRKCPCSWRIKDDVMVCEVTMHYCPEEGRHKYCPIKLKDKEVVLFAKFRNMEKYFRSDNTYSVEALDVADKIKVAKLLCKRIIDDDYVDNALIPVKQKYGELKYHFESTNEESKARQKAYRHSDYMKKQDIEYLFKLLSKHIREFWD